MYSTTHEINAFNYMYQYCTHFYYYPFNETILYETKPIENMKNENIKNDDSNSSPYINKCNVNPNIENKIKSKPVYQIYKKIIRGFLNNYMRRLLIDIIESNKEISKKDFKRLKPKTLYNLNTSNIKLFLSKTLKEVYEFDNNPTNLRVIEELSKINKKFELIIQMPVKDIYNNYINSKEFEITKNVLRKTKDEDYIQTYHYYARSLLLRFEEKKPNLKKKN